MSRQLRWNLPSPVRYNPHSEPGSGIWDADLTADPIITEAGDKPYGLAAEHMFEFYRILEQAMAGCDEPAGNWNLLLLHQSDEHLNELFKFEGELSFIMILDVYLHLSR